MVQPKNCSPLKCSACSTTWWISILTTNRHVTVSIVPNELRDEADIQVKCVSKLAGLKKLSSHVYVARHRGHLVAVEHNPKQAGLFEENPKPALVANGPGASKPEAARD